MTRYAWWREPTRAQWCAFGAAWAGWVLDAFDFTIFMLVMPNIARDFHVASVATAGSITLTLFARLAGGFIAGAAADRWGRKVPLMISIVWFAACDGAVALAPDDSRARGSLRFSLGHTPTQHDVDAVAAVLGEVVDRARRAAAR